ncbi:MAG: PulJ/GspJ family protein [Candidatus Xenobia bacterium]
MTLIELLVGLTVFSAVLTLMVQILVPAMKLWYINSVRARLGQSAELLQEHVIADLQVSTPLSLTALSTPPAVGFLSFGYEQVPGGWNPVDGRPLWRKFVVYWLDASSNTIWRKEWPGPRPVPKLKYAFPLLVAKALTPAEMMQLIRTRNGSERPMAVDVSALSITTVPGEPIDISYTLQQTSPKGLESVARSFQLRTRN